MENRLHIELLQAEHIPAIAAAFRSIGWNKPAALYQRYLREQQAGGRTVLVALWEAAFAGYVTINWSSSYPPFAEQLIPEIQDFNVLPHLRRRGIGTALLAKAERLIAERSETAGIGVGMDSDYGAAQRLYVKRGYIPDGRGLFFEGRFVRYGDQVTINDHLALYLTKALRTAQARLPDGE